DPNIDEALADEAKHETDGMGGGCAGADRAEGWSLDAEIDTDMGRRRTANELEEHQRIVASPVLGEELIVGPFDGVQATGSRTDDAGRTIAILERGLELRLCKCFGRSRSSELRVAIR